MLVEMGVGFRVDPLKDVETEIARPKAPVAVAPRKVGKGRKSAPHRGTPSGPQSVSAVDRLREAMIRNQGSGTPGDQTEKREE
jgi:hypothetical protein